jgi:predicted MFS family arabinose efflux permease
MLVVFARWFPAERLSTVASIAIAIGNIGGLAATTPLAYLVEIVGWRASFLAVAAMTAAVALIIACVRDSPAGYQAAPRTPTTLYDSLIGMREVLLQREIYPILAIGCVAYGPGMVIVGLWGGPYLRDIFGFDAIARSMALFAVALASPVAIALVGPLDRVFNTRKGVVVTLAVGSMTSFVALALVGDLNPWLAILLMVAINGCQGFYVTMTVHCRALFPDHLVARSITTLTFVGVAMVAVMLYGTGLIVDAFPAAGATAEPLAYRVIFLVVALAMAVAIAIYTRSKDVRPLG